jgi:ankyrin repeat protein
MAGRDDVSAFREAIRGLRNGDFSRLEPLFEPASGGAGEAPVVAWHREGRFRDEPEALAEALSCACFLGKTSVAEYLLEQGVDPSAGAATGMNAFHWAANRGQVAAVELLLNRKAQLEARNMYGGTVLGTTVWSAIHEPRPGQLEIIELLLRAGAQVDSIERPTGHEAIDAILKRHGAV